MSDGLRYGGGAPMSRSSSASSFLDDRDGGHRTYFDGGKRPFDRFDHHFNYLDLPDENGIVHQPKRPRYVGAFSDPSPEPAFFILREAAAQPSAAFDHNHVGSDPTLENPPVLSHWHSVNEVFGHRYLGQDLRPISMERTSSGLSITSDKDEGEISSNYSDMRKDEQAAARVERHLAHYHKRARDSTAERILRSLISPRSSPRDEFEIDNTALQSIFRAANEIFFYGCLKGRVRWDWSDGSNERYRTQIIGTTALRVAKDGGYETLIVLSHQYLKDKRYNRRLLISTFLHELIHSYLFIRCGFKARRFGGHTGGFHRIARLIDEWAGRDTLFLGNMEADLDDFRRGVNDLSGHDAQPCCGMKSYDDDADGSRPVTPDCRWFNIR